MADQLAINVQAVGVDAAKAALAGLQQQAQQTASAINALGGNLKQASDQHDQHTAAVGRSMHAYLSLGSAIGTLPGPLGALGHAFGAIHTQITDVQAVTLGLGAAITGLGLTIGGGLAGAVEQTIRFQEQMGILRATLPVADVEQFGGALNDLAQKLGQDTVFSSTQAIEAMGGLARAGLSTSDILGGVAKSTLDMAAAMGTDPKNAALALGAAIREFNLTAADAPKVADLFSQAVHVAGLSADGLRTALGQAGPIIRAMGGDLTDAVTGIELLTRSGVSAQRAGTQLAQLYQDVVNPRTAAAAKVMKDLGFITEETGNKFVNEAGQVRPFVEVARILSEGLSQLTPQQEALATQTEFSRRAMLGAMIVANQYATGGLAALTEAQQNARTAAEAMQERLNNLWGATKQLSSSIQTLAVDIGGALTPAIRPAVDGLKGLVDGFVQLGPQAHQTIAVVAGVEAAVLALSGVLVTISTVAPLVASALAGVGISLTAILGPIGLLAVVSGTLAAAWVNDWGGIQEVVLPALANLRMDLELTTTYITGVMVPAVQKGAGDIREALVSAFTGTGAAIQDALAQEFAGGIIGQFAAKGFDQDRQVLVNLGTATGIDWGRAVKEAYIASLGGGLLVGVKTVFDQLRPGMQEATTGLVEGAEPTAEEAWRAAAGEQAKAYIEKFQQSVQGLMMQFLDDAKGSYPKAIQEALAAGMQAVAAGLMTEQDQVKVINDAIKNLSAARRAEILEIEHQEGVEAALLHVYESGIITEEQYQNALDGIAESHKKVKTALEEHKAALAAMAQSTDVAAVAQGLFSQHLDAFIEKNIRLLPQIEAQAQAYINAGKTMEALGLISQATGLSQETLIAASQGVVTAQRAVKAAVEETTGSHEKAKTAAKTHAEAIRELVQSSDASLVAIGLADQAYDKFATSTLPKLPPAIQAQVVALRNAGESADAAAVAANHYGFSLDDVNQITEGSIATTAKWNAALKGELIPAMNSYSQAIYDLNPNLDRAKAAGAAFGLMMDQASEIAKRAIAIQKEWQAALKEDAAAGRDTVYEFTVLRDSFAQAAQEIANAAAKAQNAGQQMRQVGGYIQDGIRVGFQDFSSGELWQRVNGGLQALHDQARDALRAHSPSQLWAEDVGRPMAEGIGVGFLVGVPSLVSTVQSGLQQVVDTASDYARRAAGAFDAGLVFSGGSDAGSRATGIGSLDAAQRYAQLYTRETGYSLSSFGLGPEGRAVDVQKQAQAFLDAQKSYWESQYGTTDPAKAQAAYQASLPASTQAGIRYENLLNSSASSLFSSLVGKLPLAAQASYQQQAAGSPEALMRALQTLWGAGGGNSLALSDLLNNVQQPSGYNPLLGPSANAVLAGGGGGSTSSPGGNLTGTSGTGFAQSPISFYDAKTGVLPSGGRTLDYGDMARNAADFSKALASLGANVPIVALSWSSIRDWSKQAETSIAGIPQAFSAFPLTPTPGLGNPAANTGGSGAFTPSGNTYGGASFGALQTLIAQITQAHPDLSPDAQARAIQQGMRTNADYLRVVGTLTDTTSDLQRQQEDATNEVTNWTNVVAQQGAAYAAGTGAMQSLVDAQAHLAAVTNSLAATATAPPPASTPWVGTPGGPPPAKPPEGAPPGHWVVGPYGQGWQWLADSSATVGGKITTTGLPMAAGGIVTGPTRALLGEAGPEAVIPLGRGMGGGGPVTVNLTYNAGGGGAAGNATDMAAFVRRFREEARRQGVDLSRLGGI